MSHFSSAVEFKNSTPHQWLSAGASIGRLVNTWSFRDDLAVTLGYQTAANTAACFNPVSAEIEINIDQAFAGALPEDLSGLDKSRIVQLDHASGVGAVFHEALHARYSRWSLVDGHKALGDRGYKFASVLEEGRIEAFGIRALPENRVLLRSCAVDIVLGEIEQSVEQVASVDGAAYLACLTLARVDAGVLDADDVDAVRDVLEKVLGTETISKLRSVWLRFQSYDMHSNLDGVCDLTREFLAILDERKEETGEQGDAGEQGDCGLPGDTGEGSTSAGGASGTGSLTPEQIESLKEQLRDAIEDMVGEIKIANQGEIDDAIQGEEWKNEVAIRAGKSQNKRENKKVAEEVFARAVGSMDGVTTKSRLKETRKPTSEERISAVKISKLLEKAKYRERSQTEIQSVLPPGRLRTRAVVQAQALKAKGSRQQVEAWRRTERHQTDSPTLRVGVMVDISGSMNDAMEPMATTAWVMSEAIRRVQGKCSMVYFGEDVFPTLKQGQHLSEVRVYTAPDGTEKFDKAFKALDGEMNLLHGKDARLLVVVSDGEYYGDGQATKARDIMRECDRNGVAVLWIDFSSTGMSNRLAGIVNGSNVKVANVAGGNLTAAADLVGRLGAEALTGIGKAR